MSKSRSYIPDEKKLHRVEKKKNSRTKYPYIDYNSDTDEDDVFEGRDDVDVTID